MIGACWYPERPPRVPHGRAPSGKGVADLNLDMLRSPLADIDDHVAGTTSVLAVPRSNAKSLENMPMSQFNMRRTLLPLSTVIGPRPRLQVKLRD